MESLIQATLQTALVSVNKQLQKKLKEKDEKLLEQTELLIKGDQTRMALERKVDTLESEVSKQRDEILALKRELDITKDIGIEDNKNSSKSICMLKRRIPYSWAALRNRRKKNHGVDRSKILAGFFCECGLKFSKRSSFQQHIVKTTKKKVKVECAVGKRRNGLGYLKMHFGVNKTATKQEVETAIACLACGISFDSQEQFNRHKETVH